MFYYDGREGRHRIKPRYAWALWSFGAGCVLGAAVTITWVAA